ncbi:hypothetical protein ACJJTC_001599 [Scirpophaga incertulas]
MSYYKFIMVFVKRLIRSRRGQIFKEMADFEKAAAPTEPDVINPVRDYLISWGLSQYVDKFEEHCIDLETLQILSAEDIKELIPVIGHRAKLTSQIAMLKNIITDAYSSSTTMYEVDTSSMDLSTSILDTSNLGLESDMEQQESLETEDSKRAAADCSTNEGKGLLLRYEASGLLDNASRRRLCSLIINNELKDNPDQKITSSRFYHLSHEITNIFKKERAAVYFIPFTKFSPTQKISAKGKLLDCFRQKRRDFIKTGIIKTKERLSSSVSSNESGSPHPGTSSSVQEAELLQDNEEISEKLLWLKNCCDPWEIVEKYWAITTKSRLRLLQSQNLTIQQYFSDFKALNQPGGIYLLLQDYKNVYPMHDEKLSENWLLIQPKILELAKKEI